MWNRVCRALRGLYFIRFSVALWGSLLLLCYLDGCTGAAALTRAILTPENCWQAVTAAFMVCSAGIVVLLTLRLVALNGGERFPCELDEKSWLRIGCGRPTLPFWLFLLTQLPGICILWYVAHLMHWEEVGDPAWSPVGSLLSGVGLAYIFWLGMGLVYYWTFDPCIYKKHKIPREIVLPRWLIPLTAKAITSIQQSPAPPLIRALEPLFRFLARFGGAGFADPDNPDKLYEGHRLGVVSILGLLLIYVYLFAFTAPVKLTTGSWWCNLISSLSVTVVFACIVTGDWKIERPARVVKFLASAILLVMLVLIIWRWTSDIQESRSFSVLASVLVLLVGVFWLLSTIAFLSDNSRLPVFSGSVVLLLAIKAVLILIPQSPPAEHYFSAIKLIKAAPRASLPSEILDSRLKESANAREYEPLIVITAQGGGIHSAAWTAAVLAELEKQFHELDSSRPFHSNILFASGVSGGSVGLLPFLREYTADSPFADLEAVRMRITGAANCSSLEGVAWGLSYYDALNFVFPLPFFRPANGIEEGFAPTHGTDRSWALERGFDRNLIDPACFRTRDIPVDNAPKLDGYSMTLEWAADRLKQLALPAFPAFTFNTTSVETGARFLLANYELPDGEANRDLNPAASFLHEFAEDHKQGVETHPDGKGAEQIYADLPLAAAARMSATFPYVSSASRIPFKIAESGHHFVDGGYFDNDGTSSAMEFLHYAVTDRPKEGRRLPILLIEIRNDPDMNPTDNADDLKHQEEDPGKGKRKDWGPSNQIGAPPSAFLNAAQKSDTRRNRRELCMLEKAYADRLSIHHMVFDYRDNYQDRQQESQPLSWELTRRQQDDVACAVAPKDATGCEKASSDAYTDGTSIRELAHKAAIWFSWPTQGNACEVFGRSHAD